MEIKILGPGCPRCTELEVTVRDVVQELDSTATVVKIPDLMEIAEMGVMSTPAVVVDGAVKCLGRVPSKAELKRWLSP